MNLQRDTNALLFALFFERALLSSMNDPARYFDISDNLLDGVMPASLCSLDLVNLTYCNVTLGGSNQSDGWDCSTVLLPCAQELRLRCGAGDKCSHTARLLEPTIFFTIVGLCGLVVIGVLAAWVSCYVFRSRQRKVLVAQEKHRAVTVNLLQSFLGLCVTLFVLHCFRAVDDVVLMCSNAGQTLPAQSGLPQIRMVWRA